MKFTVRGVYSALEGAEQVDDPEKLRELACWYREFAERSGNPTIWDARLRTAEDLEAEAARIEQSVLRSIAMTAAPT